MNCAHFVSTSFGAIQHDHGRTPGTQELTLWVTALPEKLVATGDTKASAPMRAARAASAMVLNMVMAM